GQGVGEGLPLRLVRALQEIQVLADAAQAVLPHPPRQAAVDHVLLARRQGDAGALADQLARPLEVALRVGEFAQGRGGRHGSPAARSGGARRAAAGRAGATGATTTGTTPGMPL